jgi:uncharacterized membrane protein
VGVTSVPLARPSPAVGLARRVASIGLAKGSLLAAVAAWAIGFSALAARRHGAFLSHRFDLGNMTQALWSTTQGRPLEVTTATGDQMSRLGSHVDPLLVLFTPLWWIWPSPAMLTTAQALALASGALPVFWLARKHVGDERAAWCLAIAYLLYPAIQWNALNDFHPVAFAIPLLLLMVWFLDEDRLFAAAVVGVLAASSKENVPLVIAGLGVWYAVRRGRPLAGTVIMATGLAWTAFAVLVVVPRFSHGPNPFYGRYASVGGSPEGIVHTLFHDPLRVWGAATTSADLRYLVLLLVPLLGLWAMEPLLALAAAPILALNLLSDFWSMNRIEYQYVSGIVPCLFAAAAIGAGRLGRKRALVAAAAVLMAVGIAALSGPLAAIRTYGEGSRAPNMRSMPAAGAKLKALRSAIALVPPAAAVTASNRVGAHLSERRRIFLFPVRAHADWVVVDTADTWLAAAGEAVDPKLFDAELAELHRDPAWRLVFHEAGVEAYRRVVRGA